ncbi:MAG: DUF3426 domain-containing protein [Pseudomonadales bacterium]|nr:DUF3426 domain-containing protein [Pseudomonadales bacterium]
MSKTENITRCPFCQTAFRVTGSQLGAADGAVRCGACLQVFQARDYFFGTDDVAAAGVAPADIKSDAGSAATADQNLFQQLPREPEPGLDQQRRARIVTITSEYGVPPPAADPDDDFDDDFDADFDDDFDADFADGIADGIADGKDAGKDGHYPELLFAAEIDAESMVPAIGNFAAEVDHKPVAEPVAELVVELVEGPDDGAVEAQALEGARLDLAPEDPEEIVGPWQAPAARRQWRWLLASLVMFIGLVAQYGWYRMDDFAQNARLRPYYADLCRFAGCELPVYRQRDLLQATDLVVRSQGAGSDVLLVDVLIKNSGEFHQLFPDLVLSFTDADARLVARRTFRPSEYLAGELKGLRYFSPYTEVRLALKIIDPGKRAIGYSLTIDPAS